MKKITSVAGLLLFCFSMGEAKVDPCKAEKFILQDCKIDLGTKATKGWIRLLKNNDKMQQSEIVLTKAEATALINCLTIKLNQEKQTKIGRMQ